MYRDRLEIRPDSSGQTSYWIAGESPTGIIEPGSDFWALANDYVSITPLSLDLTDGEKISTLETWQLKT